MNPDILGSLFKMRELNRGFQFTRVAQGIIRRPHWNYHNAPEHKQGTREMKRRVAQQEKRCPPTS